MKKRRIESKNKQVRIPVNKLEVLDRIAKKEGKSCSQVIREAIGEYIMKYPDLMFNVKRCEGEEEIRLVMTKRGRKYILS